MRSTRLGARRTRAAPGAWRPNGPVRPSRTGVRLGEGRAPARPGFACPAPAIGCRPPPSSPTRTFSNLRGFPCAHVLPQRTRPPQRKRLPRQARHRRPGRAPHTSSRTPPQSAAPPQVEIPLRNNLFSLDSSVECLTQRRREAESAENARNLANTMNYASNLLEAKHHLKGETTNCSGHCDKTTNLQFSQHSQPLCASA